MAGLTTRCNGRVWRGYHEDRCSKTASTVTSDGRGWCRLHNPDLVEQKRKLKNLQLEAEQANIAWMKARAVEIGEQLGVETKLNYDSFARAWVPEVVIKIRGRDEDREATGGDDSQPSDVLQRRKLIHDGCGGLVEFDATAGWTCGRCRASSRQSWFDENLERREPQPLEVDER